MFALAPVFVLIAVMAAATCEELPQSRVSLQMISPADMDNLLKQHPDAQLLSAEVSNSAKFGKDSSQPYLQMIYTLGARVAGDQVVASNTGFNNWDTPQDVLLTISYPASDTGAVVSYLEITVNQSTSQGRAVVVAGGIGQRSIVVVVEALNSHWFGYSSIIYGV